MSTCNNSLALCKSTVREKFWMDDFTQLYKNGNLVKFFPKYESTRVEQLNAATRFFIYFIILALIFNKNDEWLYLPITAIVIIVIMYNVNKNDALSSNKELDRILNIRKAKRDKRIEEEKRELQHDGDEHFKSLELEEEQSPYNIETGYIDSNGDLLIGKGLKPGGYHRDHPEPLFTVDELEDYRKNTCRRPTPDNPFMNPDITEFNNGDQPQACNVDDADINDEMRVNFNHNLFRDIDDLWERENSQRQFYTTPNTSIPSRQTEFAEWLYKIPKTCKEDGANCLRYEDLRFKR